jgi:hypothetical protein
MQSTMQTSYGVCMPNAYEYGLLNGAQFTVGLETIQTVVCDIQQGSIALIAQGWFSLKASRDGECQSRMIKIHQSGTAT